MGFLTSLVGGIGGKLLGGLLGGSSKKKSSGATRAAQIEKSDLQKQLEGMVGTNLEQGMPSYEGNLNTEMSGYFDQATGLMGNNSFGGNTQLNLPGYVNPESVQSASQFGGQTQIKPSQTQNNMTGVVNDMLAGNNLGMSEKEMQTYMGQVGDTVQKSLANNLQNTFRNTSRRGLLSSDITADGMINAQNMAGETLANAQGNMFMQNEQLKRQQLQQALAQAMGLSQLDTSQQQQNISNEMQKWISENNMSQQDIQNLMNLANMETGVDQQNIQNAINVWAQEQGLNQQDISNLLSLGQIETGVEENNINRSLQNFYQQQALNQVPFNQALSVLTGATLPLQQLNSGIQQGNANLNYQQNADRSAGLGGLLGSIISAPTGNNSSVIGDIFNTLFK